jgi:mRNA interferase MazF
MEIRQGDLFWLDLGEPEGSGPGYLHPHLVVQNDVFNESRLATTVVCALTSNLARANSPGNVALERGEGGLPKCSVVNITQIFTVDKSQLVKRIGKLSPLRTRQVLEGLVLLLEPRSPR